MVAFLSTVAVAKLLKILRAQKIGTKARLIVEDTQSDYHRDVNRKLGEHQHSVPALADNAAVNTCHCGTWHRPLNLTFR